MTFFRGAYLVQPPIKTVPPGQLHSETWAVSKHYLLGSSRISCHLKERVRILADCELLSWQDFISVYGLCDEIACGRAETTPGEFQECCTHFALKIEGENQGGEWRGTLWPRTPENDGGSKVWTKENEEKSSRLLKLCFTSHDKAPTLVASKQMQLTCSCPPSLAPLARNFTSKPPLSPQLPPAGEVLRWSLR